MKVTDEMRTLIDKLTDMRDKLEQESEQHMYEAEYRYDIHWRMARTYHERSVGLVMAINEAFKTLDRIRDEERRGSAFL